VGNQAIQRMIRNGTLSVFAKPLIQREVVDDESGTYETWKTEDDVEKVIDRYKELKDDDDVSEEELEIIKELVLSSDVTFTADGQQSCFHVEER
jgi:hypothetical protein